MCIKGLNFALAFLLLLDFLPCDLGLVTSGTLPVAPAFSYYAGKFCYDFSKTAIAGSYSLQITGVVKAGPISGNTSGRLWLFVYDDEKDEADGKAVGVAYNEHHWHYLRSRWTSVTCDERQLWSSGATDLTLLSGTRSFTVHVMEKIRPRFWFFTFANCGANIVESVNYELHMLNPLKGPESELSIDKHGSLWLHSGAACVFVLLMIVQFCGIRRASGPSNFSFRPVLSLLMLSVLLSAIGEVCLAAHYKDYESDGIGIQALEILGALNASLSKAVLTTIQLLIAKGWGVLKTSLTCLWISLFAALALLTVTAELYGEFVHDQSTTLYLYEGPFGLLILSVNAVLFIVALKAMTDTYSMERSSEVRSFYWSVSVANTIFFLSLPLAWILAHRFNPWVRAKYVARIEMACRFVASAMLTYCLWPSSLDIMINARVDGLEFQGRDYGPGEDELEELEPSRE